MSEAAVRPLTEHSPEEIERVKSWINTEEYKEKNFAREALVINPAHACQPLGAQMVAHGLKAPCRLSMGPRVVPRIFAVPSAVISANRLPRPAMP